MKIETTNVLDIKKGIIVHGCNCEGGFGSGIAGQIRRRFPQVAAAYDSIKWPNYTLLGTTQPVRVTPDVIIVNAFTQKTFGGESGVKYAIPKAIKDALSEIATYATAFKILEPDLEVHLPLIGAGLGGLDWETEVKPIYEEVEEKLMKPHGMEFVVHFYTPPVVPRKMWKS